MNLVGAPSPISTNSATNKDSAIRPSTLNLTPFNSKPPEHERRLRKLQLLSRILRNSPRPEERDVPRTALEMGIRGPGASGFEDFAVSVVGPLWFGNVGRHKEVVGCWGS